MKGGDGLSTLTVLGGIDYMRDFLSVAVGRLAQRRVPFALGLATTVVAATFPVVARGSSGSSGEGAALFLSVVGVALIIARFIYWSISKSKVSVTRADGTVETPSSDTTPARKGPPRALVGRSTTEFGFLEDRNSRVFELKQQYGNAVRIVHRGRTGFGRDQKHVLVTEIPAKCPKCKEAFSVDTWGLLDCPGCSEHLAVIFKDQKKMVYVVTGVNDDGTFTVAVPETPVKRSRPKAAPSQPAQASQAPVTSDEVQNDAADGVEERFNRIAPKS